jgi:hypothetical protein
MDYQTHLGPGPLCCSSEVAGYSAVVRLPSFVRRPQPRVLFQLNVRLQPAHRHRLYDDRIDRFLAERSPRSRIDGGGTAVDETGIPSRADISVLISDDEPQSVIQELVRHLENRGLPTGSLMQVGDAQPRSIGSCAAVEVRLPPLEPDALDDMDVPVSDLLDDHLVGLERRLASARIGELASWSFGDTLTSVICHGRRSEDLLPLVGEWLMTTPWASSAAVSVLADAPADPSPKDA